MTRVQQVARRKRLVVLADFLENEILPTLNGRKFDMRNWAKTKVVDTVKDSWGWLQKQYAPIPAKLDQTAECGYEGCAIGWGYYCPKLVKAGIRGSIEIDKYGMHPDEVAVAEFFGISYYGDDEFSRCFMPSNERANTGKKGVRRVAAVLRKVAAAEPD